MDEDPSISLNQIKSIWDDFDQADEDMLQEEEL